MRETYETLRDRSEAIEVGADPMLENQLATAERALTQPPVDLGRAKAAMGNAQEALKGYIQRVEAESDRRARLEAERQAQQATMPMPMGMGYGGWMPGPIILLNDRQTIGGYPRLGALTPQAVARLAQCLPGEELQLAPVLQETAQESHLRLLEQWRHG